MTSRRAASRLILLPLAGTGTVIVSPGCTSDGESGNLRAPGSSGSGSVGPGSGGAAQMASGATGFGVGGDGTKTQMPPAHAGLDPGRVTLRRLNNTEYNNTERDLLGTSLRPGDAFPPDEVSDGFNTIGSTLAIPPSRLEGYESAAQSLVDELFAFPATDTRRKAVLSCSLTAGQEDACGEKILSALMRSAFRRPTDAAEVGRLSEIAKMVRGLGASAEEGLKAALRAVLMAPQFVFRVEKDSAPGSSAASVVSDYELATRLSYFIWASMPDQELSAEADAGHLTQQTGALTRQLDRMLASPKAASLADSFASQWLGLLVLATKQPSVATFADYDATNFLIGTSHPDRTSSVKRGAWVLTNLLCSKPPPAAADGP